MTRGQRALYWIELVEKLAESGFSAAAFCPEHNFLMKNADTSVTPSTRRSSRKGPGSSRDLFVSSTGYS
ncbi:MAG TPA: hypothetical protein EYP06_04530 [Desulfobacterales bacterium]|nr:hypothetical protein [Desulfobacterales bacterium]